MSKEWTYAIIGFSAGVVLMWLLASTVVNTNQYGMMQMMGISSTARVSERPSDVIDSHFIEQMIPHHEDAITMANLAQTRAKRDEVKVLAQNIIDSQSREITQMKNWYKAWYGKDVPENETVMGMHGMGSGSTLHMGMMGNETDITRLENAEDFDTVFVEEMIPHHQMAVMMATMLKNGTNRPEMKQLAEDIIAAQTKEIDDMRGWLLVWNQ